MLWGKDGYNPWKPWNVEDIIQRLTELCFDQFSHDQLGMDIDFDAVSSTNPSKRGGGGIRPFRSTLRTTSIPPSIPETQSSTPSHETLVPPSIQTHAAPCWDPERVMEEQTAFLLEAGMSPDDDEDIASMIAMQEAMLLSRQEG